MRVYVESNFLLELAYRQEEHEGCQTLLGMAEQGTIELVLPALSFVEVLATLRRRVEERRQSVRAVQKLGRELGRSGRVPAGFETILDEIAKVDDLEEAGLANTQDRVLGLPPGQFRAIDLDSDVVRRARELPSDLQAMDASILAAVLVDLERRGATSLFINRNVRDFEKSSVKGLLSQVNCTLIRSFRDGAARLAKQAARSDAR